MRKHFLKYLVDPKTGEELSLTVTEEDNGDVIQGTLSSRFAGYMDDPNYTKSFGYQWNKWLKIQFDSANVGKTMEGATEKMWGNITGKHASLNNEVIVDFGCGPGRFLETIKQKDIRWSVLNTFDSVTPSNQSGFTPYEVFQWCKSKKLKEIEPSNWAGASFTAKK